MNIKKYLGALLRRNKLFLKYQDTVSLYTDIRKNKETNQQFLSSHPGFIVPPYHLAYEAYNHTNWQFYYRMGLQHSRLISDHVQEFIQGRDIKICEWGCGPARVLRHLDKIEGIDNVDLYGADYNGETIKWCKDNLKNINFTENNLEPPLPYTSETFDCIYAISVFTHLSERMHHAWLKELLRTLKPDGILIFTTHGDCCAGNLSSADKENYDSGTFVDMNHFTEGKKHYAAFHPKDFMDTFLKDCNVIKHISDPFDDYRLKQDVWIIRKD